jgi:hypothetical protein
VGEVVGPPRARIADAEQEPAVLPEDVDRAVDVVGERQQLGMDPLHVVHLVEGVDPDLPVALPEHADVLDEVVLRAEVVGVEVLGEGAEEVAQRLGVGVHVHEHPAVPRLAAQVGEADAPGRVALGEVVGVGHPVDPPVEPVRPQVVRALELRRVPRPRLAQPPTPVLTRVVEGAHALGLGPHDDDRLGAEVEHEIVADLGKIRHRAGEVPHPCPHAIPLERHELAGEVALLGDELRAEVGLGQLPRRRAMVRVERHERES